MTRNLTWTDQVMEQGVAIIPRVLDRDSCLALGEILDRTLEERSLGGGAGVRDLLGVCPEASELACSDILTRWVRPILGENAFPVRGLLFDKTSEANWKVAWHQDLTIAVESTNRDAAGFGPWTFKGGIPHAHAPAEVLERMLTIRLHLDDCGADNGPLKVLPGSHAKGKLGPKEIQEQLEQIKPLTCLAQTGDAILMRPLILHASWTAQSPSRRRVIHLEYAASALPCGLSWREPRKA